MHLLNVSYKKALSNALVDFSIQSKNRKYTLKRIPL